VGEIGSTVLEVTFRFDPSDLVRVFFVIAFKPLPELLDDHQMVRHGLWAVVLNFSYQLLNVLPGQAIEILLNITREFAETVEIEENSGPA